MIPSEHDDERKKEKSGGAGTPSGPADESDSSSTRWYHWEISTTRSFPTARDVEQRFEERLRRWRVPQGEAPADIYVVDQEIAVEMDLPGVDVGDLQAHIEDDCLVVEATRRLEPPSERARAVCLERPRGPLRRRIPLPFSPGPARIDLELRSGVLLLRVVPERRR